MKYHVLITSDYLRCELEWDGTSAVGSEQARAIIERCFPSAGPAAPLDVKTEVNIEWTPAKLRDLASLVQRAQSLDRKVKFGCAT